jgi:hypothetical protein
MQENLQQEKSTWFCLLIILLLFSQAAYGIAGQGQYRIYHNARFDYSVSYPADLLIPQGEAENGDGQRFLTKDGKAEMLVYGSNNALEQTLQQAFAETSASRAKDHPGRVVSYKVLRQDWFAVSGTENGKIFYQKTFLKSGVFKTLRLEYDETQKAIYDSITAAISKSFTG